MTITSNELQQVAWKYFTKKNGYSIRPDVLTFLKEKIDSSRLKTDQIPRLVEFIADSYAQVMGNSSQVIDKSSLSTVVEKLFKSKINISNSANADPRSFIHFIDSQAFGSWQTSANKQLLVRTKSFMTDKLEAFRLRFTLLLQRFRALHSKEELFPINSLKGLAEGKEVSVFGIVTELREGELHLEDLDDSIRIEFDANSLIDHSVGKGCFCLVKGIIKEDTKLSLLYVKEMKSPGTIDKESHKRFLPFYDIFSAVKRVEKHDEIRNFETLLDRACICVINNPWIDKPLTQQKLEKLFRKFNDTVTVPFMIVFCGELFSQNFSGNISLKLDEVASLCKNYCSNSIFVFTSSQKNSIFPQCQFQDKLFFPFADRNLSYKLTENPTRLVYCNQEIVIFDDSLPLKLFKESLNPEVSFEKSKREVFRLVTDQGFLTPLESQTFHPCFHSYLSLYPPPDVLFLNHVDRNDSFLYHKTMCLGQSSFSIEELGRIFIYFPSSREVTEFEF